MVARSLVLVLFHVGCALCLYGLSWLVALPAFAGNDLWTRAAGESIDTSCDAPEFGGIPSCVKNWQIANVGLGGGTILNQGVNTVDATLPTLEREVVTCRTSSDQVTCVQYFAITYLMNLSTCVSPAEFDEDAGACIAPPDCGEQAGLEVDRYYEDSGPGGAICANPPGSEDMECGALVANPAGLRSCAGGECFARLVFTGDQCGGEPDATGEDLVDEPGNTNCVAGDGVTVCAAQTSSNCGTVNGQSVCLDSIPEGRCTFLGNGGMVCAAGSSSAPTEEDGETPAEPDGEFSAGSDDVEDEDYEYFGPGTVANSGAPISGPSDSGGLGGEEGEEPGGECDEPGSCVGVVPELGETETVGEATSAFLAAIEGAPLIAAAMGIGASLPEGECPVASDTIEYLGDMTLTIDAHCGLWEEIAVVLSYIMLACWVFVGVRIVLSA